MRYVSRKDGKIDTVLDKHLQLACQSGVIQIFGGMFSQEQFNRAHELLDFWACVLMHVPTSGDKPVLKNIEANCIFEEPHRLLPEAL